MATKPRKTQLTQETGAASVYGRHGQLRADEYLPKLRGNYGTKTYREMRDNDPTIGAIMIAVEMLLRNAAFRMEFPEGVEDDDLQDFADSLFTDMDGTLDEFLSHAISFLPFGFSLFEMVLKLRQGPKDDHQGSDYTDGRWGIAKLAPRPQWTVERFELADNGDVLGVWQQSAMKIGAGRFIPDFKLIHFRTGGSTDPAGRSVLRNAYTSYHYASHIDMVEAIGIERELNGLPVGRMPSSYLSAAAGTKEATVRDDFKKILRDVKLNEQGYALLPSDRYVDDEGRISQAYKIEFELLSASGTRAINTDVSIRRHQGNIARSVLADFILLGQGDKGSFALSKNKTDLFLAAAQGFAEATASTMTDQIIRPVWELNGLPVASCPRCVFGDMAPVDLEELGNYINSLAGSGMALFPDDDLENTVRAAAGFPDKPEGLDELQEQFGRVPMPDPDELPPGDDDLDEEGADE